MIGSSKWITGHYSQSCIACWPSNCISNSHQTAGQMSSPEANPPCCGGFDFRPRQTRMIWRLEIDEVPCLGIPYSKIHLTNQGKLRSLKVEIMIVWLQKESKNRKTEVLFLASPFIISACSQGNLYLARVPFEDNDDIFYAVGSFSFRPATEAECNGKTQIMEHVHIRLDLLSKVSASRFSHCSCGLKTARSAPSPSGAQVLCRFTSFFWFQHGAPLSSTVSFNMATVLLSSRPSASRVSQALQPGPLAKKKCGRLMQGNTPNLHIFIYIYIHTYTIIIITIMTITIYLCIFIHLLVYLFICLCMDIRSIHTQYVCIYLYIHTVCIIRVWQYMAQ